MRAPLALCLALVCSSAAADQERPAAADGPSSNYTTEKVPGAQDMRDYDRRIYQIVLSARLCAYSDGLRDSLRHPEDDIEKPETWRMLIGFANEQFAEIKRKPLGCKEKLVRQARACLGSVLGPLNTPLGCTERPLGVFFQTDRMLPMPELPKEEK